MHEQEITGQFWIERRAIHSFIYSFSKILSVLLFLDITLGAGNAARMGAVFVLIDFVF